MVGREEEYVSLLGSTYPGHPMNITPRPNSRPRKISLAIEVPRTVHRILPTTVTPLSPTQHQQHEPLLQSNNNNNNLDESFGRRTDSSSSLASSVNSLKNGDGGWRSWLVVLASFLCLSVLDGVSYSFGVMLEPLMEDLQCGRSGISAAGSVQTGIYALSGLVVSKFVTRYGTRLVCTAGAVISAVGLALASFSWNLASLYITYSALTGFGFGMMYIPAIVAVAEHFEKRRALALGICLCGTGVGTFFLAPIESFLLTQLGWRSTLLILGGVCLACVLCGLAMTPVPKETPEEEIIIANEQGQISDDLINQFNSSKPLRNAEDTNNNNDVVDCPTTSTSTPDWKRRGGSFLLGSELANHRNLDLFFLLVLADAVGTLALFVPFTYLPDFAVSVGGVPVNQAAILLSAGGISSSVGRILSGWLNDRPWCNAILLTTVVVVLAGIQPILLAWSVGFAYFLVFSCLFGFCTGIWIAATTPFLLKVLPLDLLSPAFGVITATQGAAALVGAPLAGALVDFSGNIQVALFFAGVLLFLAAIIFAISYICTKRREVRSSYQELI